MAADLPFISAEELDAMTPDQRLAAFRERIVTDLDEVSDEFRSHIEKTARRLTRERRTRR